MATTSISAVSSRLNTQLTKTQLSVATALAIAAISQGVFAQTIPGEYQWWSRKVSAYQAHNATLSSYLDPNGVTVIPSGNTKGSGITIAVVDSGVFKHSEFVGRLLTGRDFVSRTGGDGTNDQNGHGTHVAGTAAAALSGSNTGVAGIAPQAYILPIRVLDRSGSGSLSGIASGITYGLNYWTDSTADRVWTGGSNYQAVAAPANKKMIFSMSLGASGDTNGTMLKALQTMVASKSIAIIAAGNEGALQPSFPARYVTDNQVAGFALAVGAVDSNNAMASWSNRAGAMRDYYMVAPGVSIYATSNKGTYTTMSGTSMATPVVSGAAAVVWGAWPYLTGDRVIKSLLWSATDLGAAGVDQVFGWGLLDVNRALQPLGSTCATTGAPAASGRCSYSDSTAQPVSATQTITANTYGVPAAAGSAVAKSDAKIVGYDQLGRAFLLPAAIVLKPAAVSAAGNMNSWMANSQPIVESGGVGRAKFSMQGDAISGMNGFSFTQAAGLNGYIMGFKGNGVIPFGLSHSGFGSNAFVGGDTMKISYLGLMESPTGVAYGNEMRNGMSWKVGYMAGGSSANSFAIDPSMPQYTMPSNGAAIVEVATKKGALQVKCLDVCAGLSKQDFVAAH